MLMLLVILMFLGAALARGGSIENIADVSFRWKRLAVAGLVLQLLIFTPFRDQPIITSAIPHLYVLSMAILAVWVFANWQIPGIVWMAAGLLMNMAAIAANGGYMPLNPEFARIAGQTRLAEAGNSVVTNNSIALSEGVRLWILTDILPVPAIIPFANIYSIGDLLLTLGAGIFLYKTVRPDPVIARAQPEARPAAQHDQ